MSALGDSSPVGPAPVIRPASPSDAAQLLTIYAPVVQETAISFEFDPPSEAEFAERIERIMATDPFLVLEIDGEIAGYAYASGYRARPAYRTTRETTVYVHPARQGSGVGKALMAALLAELAERGARVAIAVIALPNEASVGLHEALGFHLVGTIRDVAHKFDRWHDEGLWQLSLAED